MKEERDHLRLAILYPENKQLPQELLEFEGLKLKLPFSVHEIGNLLYLYTKSETYNSKRVDITVLTRFASCFLSSKNKDDLSAESIRQKMYDPSKAVIDAIIKKLTDFSKRLERLN